MNKFPLPPDRSVSAEDLQDLANCAQGSLKRVKPRQKGPVLSENPEPVTMTTLQISELTGKEHRNVMRDCRSMLVALGIDLLSFEHMSQDAYGRPLATYKLPKELVLTLVSGYNIAMRHRIIRRWMELEEAQKATLPPPTPGPTPKLPAPKPTKSLVVSVSVGGRTVKMCLPSPDNVSHSRHDHVEGVVQLVRGILGELATSQ